MINTSSRWADGALLLAMILLSGWISSQFGQIEGRQQEANIAKDYGTMALVALVIGMGAAINFAFFAEEGLNKDSRQVISLFLVGAVAGFLMTSAGKLALTKILGAGAIDPQLSVIFVVGLAVFVEEYFFRGRLYPTVKKFLASTIKIGSPILVIAVAAILVSLAFAAWHVQATGGDSARLSGEFAFSMFQIFMLEVTGSLAAPIGAHFLRNIVTGG